MGAEPEPDNNACSKQFIFIGKSNGNAAGDLQRTCRLDAKKITGDRIREAGKINLPNAAGGGEGVGKKL